MIEGLDMNALMAQAQQLQEQMMAARDSLAAAEFEGTAGGDLVRVKVTGLGELVDVVISPQACDPSDTESLSLLIVAAFRAARAQADQAAQSATPQLPGMGL